MQSRYGAMVRSRQQTPLLSEVERSAVMTAVNETSQRGKYNCSCQTIENLLSLGGQPILENLIVSLTPTDRLSVTGSSHFSCLLVENEWRLLTGKKDPLKNAYLKARLRKGFKRAGFTRPLPRKGTETFRACASLSCRRIGSLDHYPARGRKQ